MTDPALIDRANDISERLFALDEAVANARAFRALLEELHRHDLSVVEAICDDILVMYGGRKVEEITPSRLRPPQHPYSQLLKSSVLSPEVPSTGAVRHA